MTTLSRRVSCRGAPSTRQALLVRLGDTELAVPAEHLAAVAEVTRCTRIPSVDRALLGVSRVGPRVLPVIDAHQRLLGVGAERPDFPWTCVVVRAALGEVAFRVDAIVGLRGVPDGPRYDRIVLERLISGDSDLAESD